MQTSAGGRGEVIPAAAAAHIFCSSSLARWISCALLLPCLFVHVHTA